MRCWTWLVMLGVAGAACALPVDDLNALDDPSFEALVPGTPLTQGLAYAWQPVIGSVTAGGKTYTPRDPLILSSVGTGIAATQGSNYAWLDTYLESAGKATTNPSGADMYVGLAQSVRLGGTVGSLEFRLVDVGDSPPPSPNVLWSALILDNLAYDPVANRVAFDFDVLTKLDEGARLTDENDYFQVLFNGTPQAVSVPGRNDGVAKTQWNYLDDFYAPVYLTDIQPGGNAMTYRTGWKSGAFTPRDGTTELAVPEPGTWLLLGAGAAALALRRRLRRAA